MKYHSGRYHALNLTMQATNNKSTVKDKILKRHKRYRWLMTVRFNGQYIFIQYNSYESTNMMRPTHNIQLYTWKFKNNDTLPSVTFEINWILKNDYKHFILELYKEIIYNIGINIIDSINKLFNDSPQKLCIIFVETCEMGIEKWIILTWGFILNVPLYSYIDTAFDCMKMFNR